MKVGQKVNQTTDEVDMDEHRHEPEDEMVNVKVAIFFAVVLAALFFLGSIN